jgi:hypothetical protein
MAEQEFTEAGKVGQSLRSGLASAYKAAKGGAKWGYDYINDFVTEYGQEPLLNLYPQAVNLTAAAGEAIAGVANKPANLGRYPYYNLQSRFDEPSEPPTPKRTLENSDLLSEYYGGFDNVPVRKAIPVKKTNYVVKTYGDNPTSEIFTNKKQALNALKSLYSKNKKATMSNVPEDEAEKFAFGEMEEIAKNKEAIRKLRSPETQEEFEAVEANKERWAEANKAKLAKDRESGDKFADWRSDVEARRQSTDAYNTYNKELGLLKKAYSKAKRSDDPVGAFIMSKKIREYKGDVPEEAGARAKYFKNVAVSNRDAMLAEQERLAQEEEMNRRKSAANPDYSFKPVNLTY